MSICCLEIAKANKTQLTSSKSSLCVNAFAHIRDIVRDDFFHLRFHSFNFVLFFFLCVDFMVWFWWYARPCQVKIMVGLIKNCFILICKWNAATEWLVKIDETKEKKFSFVQSAFFNYFDASNESKRHKLECRSVEFLCIFTSCCRWWVQTMNAGIYKLTQNCCIACWKMTNEIRNELHVSKWINCESQSSLLFGRIKFNQKTDFINWTRSRTLQFHFHFHFCVRFLFFVSSTICWEDGKFACRVRLAWELVAWANRFL